MTTSNLNFQVYSKDNCKYCMMAIDLLKSKGINHTVTKLVPVNPQVGEMLIDDFKAKNPHVRTVPHIIDTATGTSYSYATLAELLQV